VTDARHICFLSDYGYEDDFAGTCRGVIARLAPEVGIIDITHGIARHDVLGAAFVLRNTMRYMPDGAVHLGVVDPGVGGPRRAVLLQSRGGRLFVGPDNGLLVLAAEADGGIKGAWEITNDALFIMPLSATFHGRDIFAPVAARLATGLPPVQVGPRLDPATLVRVEIQAARATKHGLRATAVLIDRFGNVALTLDADRLAKARLGDPIELVCGGERYLARLARSFIEARPSDIMVLVDSYGQVAVAVNTGSAEEVLGLVPGDVVELRRLS
jgi:S-adenosyl-L-methionine hydrolase (adenosine-forming)